MSETNERGLQRLDLEQILPIELSSLTEDEKQTLQRKIQEQDLEIRSEIFKKYGKSKLAEHDLAVAIDTVQKLDHERKIYSKHMKGETGSGQYELTIKGGDTKFVIPVLVTIGAIIIGIIYLLSLT